MGMTLLIFFLKMASHALKEIMYQRSFVRKSKNQCENVLQDPGCNASNGFWSQDLRSKILLPHDLCKEHLHGYCFQAIVVIMT